MQVPSITNAEQSKTTSKCEGACINHMRVLQAMKPTEGPEKQAKNSNAAPANARMPKDC